MTVVSPTDETFDVVIVGARCAGASLATHLGRAGLSVAVIDSAPLPSGQPNSTHLIQPPGMDELDILGIGEQVRDLTPALRTVRMQFDDHTAQFSYGSGRAAHCLRRAALDGRLQHLAVEAGAIMRSETRVTGLITANDGRVMGVHAQHRGGRQHRLLAPLVIGADGRHSTVARLVGADEYLAYDAPRVCYWAYWQRSALCDPHAIINSFTGDDQRVVFPTDSDLVLIASAPPVERGRGWKRDHTAAYLSDIRSHPSIGSLVEGDQPTSEVRGVVKIRYFFRSSAGPGWALIGDAGHHKDFIVGLGITDALRDARRLSVAIVDGHPLAAEAYWRQRDVQRMEIFHWSKDLGAADDVTALERLIAQRIDRHPELGTRLGAVMDGTLSPYRLVPPGRALQWTAAEMLRGRPRAFVEVIKTGLRERRARREVRRRQRHSGKGPPCPQGNDQSSHRASDLIPAIPTGPASAPGTSTGC